MRGFASYLVAGILVVMALDVIARPAGLSIAINGWPTPQPNSTWQSVDRTLKGNRLILPTAVKQQPPPKKAPARIMVGCDPVFSPLSASTSANFAGRCVA
jgi:hypothetical protein